MTETCHHKSRFVSAQRGKKHAVPPVATFAAVGEYQPPLVVSQLPSKKEKERYAKREMRSSVRSAEYTTAHRLHSLRLRLGLRLLSLHSVAGDSSRLQKAPSTSVDLHSISPAPCAQPPLAVSINVPCEKRCITGKMGVLICGNTQNAHPVPQSSCQK